jgi:hypothetical protein
MTEHYTTLHTIIYIIMIIIIMIIIIIMLIIIISVYLYMIYLYIYMSIYIYLYLYIYKKNIFTSTCLYIYIYIYISLSLYISISTHTHIYIYMYMFISYNHIWYQSFISTDRWLFRVIQCYAMFYNVMPCYSITIIRTIELPPAAAQGRTHHHQQLQGVGSQPLTTCWVDF